MRQFGADRSGVIRCDDIEDARRNAGARGEIGQLQRRKRRQLRRFGDHRAACRQRGGHFPRQHGVGKIPRRNGADHANRLLDNKQPPIRRTRDDVAIDAPALVGEPVEIAGAISDLDFGFRQRLALLDGHDTG